MIKLKANRKELNKDEGILYLLYMWVDEDQFVKIGVTARKIEERVVEILTSYFHGHRIFPKLYPKRFRVTQKVYKKETMMHKYFSEYSHKFEKNFSGCTEYFAGIDEEELLVVYKDCTDGVDINDVEYKPKLKEKEDVSREDSDDVQCVCDSK